MHVFSHTQSALSVTHKDVSQTTASIVGSHNKFTDAVRTVVKTRDAHIAH